MGGVPAHRLVFWLLASAIYEAQTSCHECSLQSSPCAVQISDEDRRLGASGAIVLAGLRAAEAASGAERRLAAPRFTGLPPAEITLASLALPMAGSFLDEAALFEAVVEEINNDPTLFPNTTVRGVVLSEGTDIKTMLDGADAAHLSSKACMSVGLITGPRQSLMAALAKVRNTNHGFYMDMTLGTMPRFSEVGTSFGILGWSTIIARFLDMVTSFSPPLNRFALILPESFSPMADRFDVEQKLRGISVVYKMIYDYRRVDVDATFEDADSYARQIVDGVVATKANLVFQCFCSTNNKYFRAQLFRHAIKEGLMQPGFQWFTHYPSVISFKEPWLYDEEYADIWPYLDYFKVLDQGSYEPPDYNYTSSYLEKQKSSMTDALLKPKIQKWVNVYNASLPDRGYRTLSWLDCNSTAHKTFTVCTPSAKPGYDSNRALKFDAIKQIAWALHEVIYTDGYYAFCDIDAAGVRTGDPQTFLKKLSSRPMVGYAGSNRFQPIQVVGGEVLTIPPSFMLTNWKPTFARDNGKYANTKQCIVHVNRFSLENASLAEKVMRRDFFSGKPVTQIMWMGNRTTSPTTWYHDMCGKSYRIEMSRADKKCIACPDGEFNAPLDGEDRCESISNYSCPVGTYLVEAMAAGAGLTSPCMPCGMGMFSMGGNVKSCQLCPVGTFQPGEGSDSCIECREALNGTTHFTTRFPGEMGVEACMCPEGTYRSGDTCLACPEGMTCPIGSDLASTATMPQVKAGFMTLATDALTVYQCKEVGNCIGGGTAACAENFDNTQIACANCMPGYFEEAGKCKSCEETIGPWSIILTCCLAAIVLVALLIFINSGIHMRSQSNFTVTIIVGLALMNLQTLSAMHMFSFKWFAPISSMTGATSIISFDIDLLRPACFSRSNSVGKYLFQQAPVPSMSVYCAFVLAVKRYVFKRRETRILKELVSAIGTIANVFFIGVLLSSLRPFICYAHPGNASSMSSAPEILCNGIGLHRDMIIAAIFVLLLVPVPFVAMVAYVTKRYGATMTFDERKEFLIAYRFLFLRFHPHAYYYGSVLYLRSILITLVPIVIRNNAGIQIFTMAMICVGFALFQCFTKPWRSDSCNIFDAMLSFCMISLLLVSGLAVETSDLSALHAIASVVLAGGLFLVALGLAIAVCLQFRPRPFYNLYLCHNKQETAGQVRFLKTIMAATQSLLIFIDSDYLGNLDTLYDVIKSKVDTFIAYLTASSLTRAWFCGEVVCAVKSGRKLKKVLTPSFVPPTTEQLENLEQYVSKDSCDLGRYGIALVDVDEAIRHLLLPSVTTFTFDTSLPGSRKLAKVANELMCITSQPWKCPRVQQGSVLIFVSRSNDEALATAGFLCVMLEQENRKYRHLPDETQYICLPDHFDQAQYSEVLPKARALLVLLSAATMATSEDVSFITAAMRLSLDAAGRANPLIVVPVHLPDFTFPQQKALDDEVMCKHFFQMISIQMPLGAPEELLLVQVKLLGARIRGLDKPEKKPGFMKMVLPHSSDEKRNSFGGSIPPCSVSTGAGGEMKCSTSPCSHPTSTGTAGDEAFDVVVKLGPVFSLDI